MQHKIELSRAGMIECFLASARMPMSKRLEQVKAYRAAWHNPIHMIDTPLLQSTGKWYIKAVTGGVLPLFKRPTSLTLWSPGSRFRGVHEVTLSLEQSLMNTITSLSVDMEQDLLAVTRETWLPGSDLSCLACNGNSKLILLHRQTGRRLSISMSYCC